LLRERGGGAGPSTCNAPGGCQVQDWVTAWGYAGTVGGPSPAKRFESVCDALRHDAGRRKGEPGRLDGCAGGGFRITVLPNGTPNAMLGEGTPAYITQGRRLARGRARSHRMLQLSQGFGFGFALARHASAPQPLSLSQKIPCSRQQYAQAHALNERPVTCRARLGAEQSSVRSSNLINAPARPFTEPSGC
jgi:hypothetical protein